MIWSGTSFFFPHGFLITSPHLCHPELWSRSFFICPSTKSRKPVTSYITHISVPATAVVQALCSSLLDCSRQPLSLLISPSCCRKNCLSKMSSWGGSPLFKDEISLVRHTRSFRIWPPTNILPFYLSSPAQLLAAPWLHLASSSFLPLHCFICFVSSWKALTL